MMVKDMTAEEADLEFAAMRTVYSALEPLDDDARARVLAYVASRLEIGVAAPVIKQADTVVVDEAATPSPTSAPKFNTFAELFSAASPKSSADKALLAGYWLQVCEGAQNFDSASANKILKHLGEGLANVTNAIDTLKNQKPQLALQLRKSGTTQQARKTYMVTAAGTKAVETMLEGDS
jgi:hypothetical protein